MTERETLFARFTTLHRPGDPLILFNAWDAGSALAIAQAGAPAVATGSWSVAAAHGFGDGEALPLDLALANAERIVEAIDVPVSIDFEGGYASDPNGITANAERLASTGAIGCNFEDGLLGAEGLYAIDQQASRIVALRGGTGAPFFINARTDVFLKSPAEQHAGGLGEAIERCEAYAAAGANGFFAPGLVDPGLIARLCEASRLPVNVMVMPAAPHRDALAQAGVARISHGPAPYLEMIAALKQAAQAHYRR